VRAEELEEAAVAEETARAQEWGVVDKVPVSVAA